MSPPAGGYVGGSAAVRVSGHPACEPARSRGGDDHHVEDELDSDDVHIAVAHRGQRGEREVQGVGLRLYADELPGSVTAVT